MNFRWLWFDHFPAELGLSRAQRAQAAELAKAHRVREPNYRGSNRRTSLIIVPLVLIFISANLAIALRPLTPAAPAGFTAPTAKPSPSRKKANPRRRASITKRVNIPLIICGSWLISALGVHLTRGPYIRRALRDMGYELCEDCGYWLRGLGDDVANCPECGASRQPRDASDSQVGPR